MSPFSWLYGSITAIRNYSFDHGWRAARRLQYPVVSVGNLSAGGAGKTPFLIALGKLLQARGVAFDILSRGYGRTDTQIRLVDEKGSATMYGDEPLLLAQKLNVPVIVGASRYHAGLHAEKLFSEVKPAHGIWLHLLDDGFQHRQLGRNFDIVIVRSEDATDRLLPDGLMREPLAALSRAHAIVLTEGATADGLPLTGQHVWQVKRKIEIDAKKPAFPKRPVAFCSIARPERFFKDLHANGIEPVTEKTFPDHHVFSTGDISLLCQLAKQYNADGFLTTEKDAVRLMPFRAELEKIGPVIAVPLVMEIEDTEKVVDTILKVASQ